MAVSGTNQSKNIVSPVGHIKAGVYTWGDSVATWGDILATWGNYQIAPVNETKHIFGSSTIYAGTPMGLLLSITYPSTVSVGSGVVNQSKS